MGQSKTRKYYVKFARFALPCGRRLGVGFFFGLAVSLATRLGPRLCLCSKWEQTKMLDVSLRLASHGWEILKPSAKGLRLWPQATRHVRSLPPPPINLEPDRDPLPSKGKMVQARTFPTSNGFHVFWAVSFTAYVGSPVVPFYPFFWWRVPLLK